MSRTSNTDLPTGPAADHAFRLLTITLVTGNVVLQLLDWITSSIGYYSGRTESNSYTLSLIHLLGNEYLAISVEKIGFIILFLGLYYLIKTLLRMKSPYVGYAICILLFAFLSFFLIEYVIVILINLKALDISPY